MPRKKFVRRLPSLPSSTVLKAKDHKTERLLEILRGISVSCQREEPQIFYPVREVAHRFRIPLSTVARVYGQLEDEGLLAAVRGSKTLLQGLSSGRHFSVHGFIGMPANISAFVALQDYRTFFLRVRRELRARGFAVATIFFEPRDVRSGKLNKRIGKYGVDTVLWHRPDTSAREIIGRLKDGGVRVVGINDGRASPIQCRYEVRREAAIKMILRDWRSRSGIKSAVIVRGPRSSAAKEEILEALLEEEHFEYAFENVKDDRPEQFLESLCRKNGVILTSWVASMLAFRAPHALMKLASDCRVMFAGGPPSIPFTQVADVPADLVIVDWQLLAERIVTDLISKKAFTRAETIVFKAQARIQAPLNEYAQSL
jgi:hypothetical protein